MIKQLRKGGSDGRKLGVGTQLGEG